MSAMAEDTKSTSAIPTLEDWQHWTLVMGRAQQMLMEYWAEQMKAGQKIPDWPAPAFGFGEQAGAAAARGFAADAGVDDVGVDLAGLELLIEQGHPAGAARQAIFGRQAVTHHEYGFWCRIGARRRKHQACCDS